MELPLPLPAFTSMLGEISGAVMSNLLATETYQWPVESCNAGKVNLIEMVRKVDQASKLSGRSIRKKALNATTNTQQKAINEGG